MHKTRVHVVWFMKLLLVSELPYDFIAMKSYYYCKYGYQVSAALSHTICDMR